MSATWAISSTEGRSCSAPNEQFSPTENGLRCCSEYQKASGVWPERLRPERSVMVPESMIGSSTPISSNTCSTAKPRRLGVQRVEDSLDQDELDAALDQPARLRGIGLDQLVEAHIAEAGLLTSGEIDAVRLVGPMAPATKRGFSGVFSVHASAASRASFAAATSISCAIASSP